MVSERSKKRTETKMPELTSADPSRSSSNRKQPTRAEQAEERQRVLRSQKDEEEVSP